MTVVSLRRATDDDALLRRARRGDQRARRLLVRRHAPRAVDLVDLIVGDGYDVAPLATRVLDVAVADRGLDGVGIDDALVRAAVRVCAPMSAEPGRLVLVLTDVEAWSEEAVAELLGRPIAEIAELRATARATAGVRSTVRTDCRGWRLVATRERATEHERVAGEAHLGLCRTCRRRDLEHREARDRLRTRGAAATAVLAADVVALSVPAGGAASAAGIAGAILGKAGVAGVGAAAVAVTITSAGVAAARQHAPQPLPHDRSTRPAVTSPGAPTGSQGTPAANMSTAVPTTAGTAPAPGRTRPLPLPSVPGVTLPPLPQASTVLPVPNVTSLLPVPLPTVTPTSLLSPLTSPSVPLPLPSVSLPTGGLLGH